MIAATADRGAADLDLGGTDRPTLLDGARGIGIAWVVASHIAMTAVYLEDIFWTQAWVAMFFGLSGFLLYHPFVAARYAGRRYSVGTFAWRRLLRIVPAAWFVVVFAGLVLDQVHTTNSGQLMPALTFTQIYTFHTLLNGLGQVWSLNVEVALYVALGVWMLAAAKRAPAAPNRMLPVELAPIAAIMVLSFAWVATSITDDPVETALRIVNPAAWMGLFAAGMGLAVLRVHSRLTGRAVVPLRVAARAPLVLWLGAVLTLAALVPVVNAAMLAHGDVVSGSAWLLKFTLDIIFTLLVLTPCVVDGGRGGVVRAAFASWPAVKMARISYGVFLWHFPVVRVLYDAGVRHDAGMAAFAAATFVITVLLGTLSYLLIERPAMRLGQRTSGPVDAFRLLVGRLFAGGRPSRVRSAVSGKTPAASK